jgi:hypothetical protein
MSLERLLTPEEHQELLSFCSRSPALSLKGERREECAAVDDTPLTDARSAKEGEMEETAN